MKKWGWKLTALLGLALAVLCGGCGNDDDCTSPEYELTYLETTVLSSDYLNNRFFLLDLPSFLPGSLSGSAHDLPGRDTSEHIDPASVMVFQLMGPGLFEESDILNGVVYPDTTGVFWDPSSGIANDFSEPVDYSVRWRYREVELMLDGVGHAVAIDMGEPQAAEVVLGVTYDVLDGNGEVVFHVGDQPGRDDWVNIPGLEAPVYRFKLLKARDTEPAGFSFQRVLRNIYDLGHNFLNLADTELKIERLDGALPADRDERGFPYVTLFGLDMYGEDGSVGSDGLADLQNPFLVDGEKGLLIFPLQNRTPFAAGEDFHTQMAGDLAFVWDGTYLAHHQAPALYDPLVPPSQHPGFGYFQFRIRQPVYVR